MRILTVRFSGNTKNYDYLYRGNDNPKFLRYLTGVGTHGAWYQTLTVVGARAIEATNVPAHVTKELVAHRDGVVAVDWHRPAVQKAATPPINNYKFYLKYVGKLAIRQPIHSWADYQKHFNAVMKQHPYDPQTNYEGENI